MAIPLCSAILGLGSAIIEVGDAGVGGAGVADPAPGAPEGAISPDCELGDGRADEPSSVPAESVAAEGLSPQPAQTAISTIATLRARMPLRTFPIPSARSVRFLGRFLDALLYGTEIVFSAC